MATVIASIAFLGCVFGAVSERLRAIRRKQTRQVWLHKSDPVLAYYGSFDTEDMPLSLQPEINTDKDWVFDDEIDPAWRDSPATDGD